MCCSAALKFSRGWLVLAGWTDASAEVLMPLGAPSKKRNAGTLTGWSLPPLPAVPGYRYDQSTSRRRRSLPFLFFLKKNFSFRLGHRGPHTSPSTVRSVPRTLPRCRPSRRVRREASRDGTSRPAAPTAGTGRKVPVLFRPFQTVPDGKSLPGRERTRSRHSPDVDYT